jgi:two-component system OmpR family sensor kinase
MRRTIRYAGGFALLAGVGVALSAAGLLAAVDRPLADLNLRLLASLRRPRQVPVACVLLGERSFRRHPAGLSRSYLAAVVARVAAERPLGIALDLLLPEGGDAAGNARLAAALASAPTLLATATEEGPPRPWILPDRAFQGVATGHVLVEPDEDGIFRRMSAFKQSQGSSIPALPILAAQFARPDLAFVVGSALVPNFAAGPGSGSIPVVDAESLLRPAGPAAPGLGGRIVLIGAAAAGASDRVYLPTRRGLPPVPGVEALAAVVASILEGGLLRELPPLGSGPMLAAAALTVIVWRRRLGRFGIPQLALALAAAETAALVSLRTARLILPAASIVVATGVTALAAAVAESAAVQRQTRRLAGELGAGRPGDEIPLPIDAVRRLQLLRELHGKLRREGERREDRRRETQRLITHELKTPLTSLAGFGRMLERYHFDAAESRRVAGLIRMESERLGKMVTALLELEALAGSGPEPRLQPLDLGELVRQRCAVLRAAAESRGQSLRLEIGGAAAGVLGDRELLGRVVDNLIGNAIQHGSEGTEIRVRLAAREGAAVLEVADQGPGIAADELPLVCERFYRGRGAAGGGAGLGLALAQEAVERHGGSLRAESTMGSGSTFRITVPLRDRGEAAP